MIGLYLITSLLLHHVHESRKENFLCSKFPFTPLERYPGHGHQHVADIKGGNRTNNSSVQLDHLLTSETPASPTLTTQRKRESSSPENALKPHHIVHIYSYSQSNLHIIVGLQLRVPSPEYQSYNFSNHFNS